jgi:pimeloyl-ACP methyl ester carboxylesterase
MALTPNAEAWRRAGAETEFRGRRIHLWRRGGSVPTLLYLHGFPSSSFDWRMVLERERDHAAIAFDFLGFGLSDKPPDHTYTLGWQADLAEEMVRRHGDGPVFLVAHDMGTSVATELMARDLTGEAGMQIAGALLFNGSILLDRARPTVAQKLLRSRLGPLFARLSSEAVFRRQFGSVFSPSHPLTPEEEADQWSLLTREGGHRIGHRLVHYMDERERFTDRWHGAIRDWPKPLFLAWGMLDPVARPAVLEGLRELRPGTPVTELTELGHYPQIEDPDRLTGAIRQAVAEASRPRAA